MIDRQGVIWTRIGVNPVKMGALYITDKEARFTYDAEFVHTGFPGLGIVYPPSEYGSNTIIRPRNQYFNFHPPIQSLIPPASHDNFMRNLIMRYLEKAGIFPEPGLETDWEILTRSAHGALGHLDVFADDRSAHAWYSTPSSKELIPIKDRFGFSLKEFLTWMDNDAEGVISFIGPTPTLGGAIPKIPLSIPKQGWNGCVGLPTRYGDSERTDIILKLEDSNRYRGLVELEMLGFEIHKQAGFETPRFWPIEINGMPALAVERFDRDENCTPLFLESIYSVAASGAKSVTNHYSKSYDFIGKMLDNKHIVMADKPKEAKLYLFKRLILAFLTGNGDLHMENLSLLRSNGIMAFSPVYDPTPMRAYARHNELHPPEMTFGNFGDFIDNTDKPISFSMAIKRFCKSLKISKPVCNQVIQDSLHITQDYCETVGKLQRLPDDGKARLIAIHKQLRDKFTNLLND